MKRFFHFIAFLISGTLFCGTSLKGQESLSDKRALSAVPVSKEPRHHNVFENKWVRVLDVRIPPGDTTLFHKHETPSVFIVLSNTKSGSEVIIEPKKIQLTSGNIWFEGFYEKPRIHRVWNSDTTEFHVMDIELLNRDNIKMDPPSKDSTLLFDEKPVRGYRINLKANMNIQLKGNEEPILVVNLGEISPGNNGRLKVNGKIFSKKGDFTFIPANNLQEFFNQQNAPAELAVFDLK